MSVCLRLYTGKTPSPPVDSLPIIPLYLYPFLPLPDFFRDALNPVAIFQNPGSVIRFPFAINSCPAHCTVICVSSYVHSLETARARRCPIIQYRFLCFSVSCENPFFDRFLCRKQCMVVRNLVIIDNSAYIVSHIPL